MKKIIPFTLFLVFASLIFAAFRLDGNPPNAKQADDLTTRAFRTYLDALGQEYPQTGHRKYLILTEDGCLGCSRQIRDEWQAINHNALNVSTIIVYFNQTAPSKFSHIQNTDAHHVIVDHSNQLDGFNIGVKTDGLVEMNEGVVTSTLTIDKTNIHDVFGRLGIEISI